MPMKSFTKCQAGNVSMMFAAAIIPILGTVGFAVDYSRAAEVKAQLAAAVDSTALALAHSSVNLTQGELDAKAALVFNGNFKPGSITKASSVTAERQASALTVNASASLKTAFLKLLNIPALDVTARSKVVWGGGSSNQKIEVVMALDNTGSMAGDKLEQLKKAAKELVDTLEQAQGAVGSVKIGLVPFASTVRVDPSSSTYKNASWIYFAPQPKENDDDDDDDDDDHHGNGNGNDTRAFNKSDWGGCIQDRDQPYDVDDTTYTGNNAKKYPAIESCPSQENKLLTVQPLTTNFTGVRTAISKMTAAGSTNVTIGIAWGMSMLSNKAPFTEGSSVTTGANAVKKYLIILTDGENTKNRFTTNTAQIDARTKLACEAARSMGTIFTIRMIEGDEALLKACASDPNNYHDVQLAKDLTTVFRAVGNQIAQLRVAE
jgi:Flp pilus assembly protein TadG